MAAATHEKFNKTHGVWSILIQLGRGRGTIAYESESLQPSSPISQFELMLNGWKGKKKAIWWDSFYQTCDHKIFFKVLNCGTFYLIKNLKFIVF